MKPDIGTVWKRAVVAPNDYTVEYVIAPDCHLEVKTLIMELHGTLANFDVLLGKECFYSEKHFYEIFVPYDDPFTDKRKLMPSAL